MHSPEDDMANSSKQEPRKLPFKRIERSLNQLLTIALPLHTQKLNEKSEKIEELKSKNSSIELHYEQKEAANFLRLLKADLYELEQLNSQVDDKDRDLFYNKIQSPIKEAIECLSRFMELHPDALEPLPEIADDSDTKFPELICHLDQECTKTPDEFQSLPIVPVQIEACLTSKSAFPDWSFLRKELLEVHSLIRNFASLVFTQKEKVDSIQNNVELAHENVQEGVAHLKTASVLKAASLPLFGAIVGGAVLGPIGAFAGFKLVGVTAFLAGGGALGYKAGTTLKKRHEISCDIEMKALTYSSKEKSTSNPELTSS